MYCCAAGLKDSLTRKWYVFSIEGRQVNLVKVMGSAEKSDAENRIWVSYCFKKHLEVSDTQLSLGTLTALLAVLLVQAESRQPSGLRQYSRSQQSRRP